VDVGWIEACCGEFDRLAGLRDLQRVSHSRGNEDKIARPDHSGVSRFRFHVLEQQPDLALNDVNEFIFPSVKMVSASRPFAQFEKREGTEARLVIVNLCQFALAQEQSLERWRSGRWGAIEGGQALSSHFAGEISCCCLHEPVQFSFPVPVRAWIVTKDRWIRNLSPKPVAK
jgi:hypothetical protein